MSGISLARRGAVIGRSQPPTIVPPVDPVANPPVDNVGSDHANFHAIIKTHGKATHWSFQYGTTTAYGTETPGGDIPAGQGDVTVTETVTGLNPSQGYHARAKATNVVGTSFGPDNTFATSAQPPPPIFVNTGAITDAGTGLTSTLPNVPMPAGIQAGDLLLAYLWSSDGNSVWAIPSGWTAVAPQVNDTSCRTVILYKISNGTESTQTFTLASGTGELQALTEAYRGVNQTNPINVSTSNWTGAATDSVTFPSITTTVKNCLLIDVLFTDMNRLSAHYEDWTTPAGMTVRIAMIGSTGPDAVGNRTESCWSFEQVIANAGATGTRSSTGDGLAANYGHAYHVFAIAPAQ